MHPRVGVKSLAVAVALAALYFAVRASRDAPPELPVRGPLPDRPLVARAVTPDPDRPHTEASGSPEPPMADEICGATDAQRRRLGKESLQEHVARLTGPALRRWRESLKASGDPRLRAIGLSLGTVDPWPKEVSTDTVAGMTTPNRDTADINDLVLLAMGGNDPAIYALALASCRVPGYQMAPGPCQGLSFAHWALVDPDNAMPWLYLAADAQRVGDMSALEAALQKAAGTHRIDGYSAALAEAEIASLPPDLSPLERAMTPYNYGSIVAPTVLLRSCEQAEIADPDRRRQCSAVGEMLAEQGTTVIEQAMAQILASRLGAPPDRQAELDQEKKELRQAMRAANPWAEVLDGKLSCKAVEGINRRIDVLAAAHGNDRVALRLLVAQPESRPAR